MEKSSDIIHRKISIRVCKKDCLLSSLVYHHYPVIMGKKTKKVSLANKHKQHSVFFVPKIAILQKLKKVIFGFCENSVKSNDEFFFVKKDSRKNFADLLIVLRFLFGFHFAHNATFVSPLFSHSEPCHQDSKFVEKLVGHASRNVSLLNTTFILLEKSPKGIFLLDKK